MFLVKYLDIPSLQLKSLKESSSKTKMVGISRPLIRKKSLLTTFGFYTY